MSDQRTANGLRLRERIDQYLRESGLAGRNARASGTETSYTGTVGSIDSASSQYVLRRTLFGASAGTATCPGIVHWLCASPVGTGLSCGSMEYLTRKRSYVTIRASVAAD